MTDAQLRKVARDFRRGILGRRPSRMMCFAVCAPLQSLLACSGYETALVEADFGYINHFWLQLPTGHILDPTADQFGLPPVYLGPLPSQYVTLMRNKAWPDQNLA